MHAFAESVSAVSHMHPFAAEQNFYYDNNEQGTVSLRTQASAGPVTPVAQMQSPPLIVQTYVADLHSLSLPGSSVVMLRLEQLKLVIGIKLGWLIE